MSIAIGGESSVTGSDKAIHPAEVRNPVSPASRLRPDVGLVRIGGPSLLKGRTRWSRAHLTMATAFAKQERT